MHELLQEWGDAYAKERHTRYRPTPNDMDAMRRCEALGTLTGLDMKDFCRKAVAFLENKRLHVSIRAALNSVNEIVDMGRSIVEIPVFDGEAIREEYRKIKEGEE